ncbi:MAG: protein kinase [Gemmataceae bacterium]|nr:protein kinase [Gemmataceae bacterium]
MTETTRPALQAIGKYDLLERVAEGGMGTVYRGRNRDSGQIVAVKVAPPHVTRNPVLLKRFEQEYSIAHALDHPNIVRALDYGFHEQTPFLVMEFVEGESLGQRIERAGRFPETEAIRLIAQVAQGLHKAHKQSIIHRDVKPDNIMLTPDGQAKLTDLGLVKEMDGDLNLTRTGRGLGTPHFMAPEQFRNAKNADARCDIYSLAATLYMMVTGELPFKSTGPLDAWMKKINNELVPPRQLVPALSERVDWAIRRAMAPDPAQRPTTCREFVEDLTGRSTRRLAPVEGAGTDDVWYLVYKDEENVLHTVKGTLGAIRRSLKEGLMGDASNVRAGRGKSGPFEPLRQYPEFRDIVFALTPATPAPPGTGIPLGPTPAGRSATLTPTPSPAAADRRTPLGSDPAVSARPSSTPGPMIDVGPVRRRGEWLKWLLLFLVAAATGLLSYYLFPLLLRGRP